MLQQLVMITLLLMKIAIVIVVTFLGKNKISKGVGNQTLTSCILF